METTCRTIGTMRNRLHRQPTDLATDVNVRTVRRNEVSQQLAMDQRDIANQRHGIEFLYLHVKEFSFVLFYILFVV